MPAALLRLPLPARARCAVEPRADSAADSEARAHELELVVATGRCRHRFHADDHGRARPAPGEAADAEVAILPGLRPEAVLAGRLGPGHRVLEHVQTRGAPGALADAAREPPKHGFGDAAGLGGEQEIGRAHV